MVREIEREILLVGRRSCAGTASVAEPDVERRFPVELAEPDAVGARDGANRTDGLPAMTRGDADRTTREEAGDDEAIVAEGAIDVDLRSIHREVVAGEPARELSMGARALAHCGDERFSVDEDAGREDETRKVREAALGGGIGGARDL